MLGLTLLFVGLTLAAVAAYDVLQRRRAILRTFPVIGHFRYWLEAVGPELRQYIVTDNDEERPFSRDQRRWVYASAKHENNYFGFGSDNDMELGPNYLIIKHDTFPLPTYHAGDPAFDPDFRIPCAKVLGSHRRRPKAFRPASVVNVSGMSFGSLSGPAVEALNRGAQLPGCLQSTGEGGVSSHHLKGGDLVSSRPAWTSRRSGGLCRSEGRRRYCLGGKMPSRAMMQFAVRNGGIVGCGWLPPSVSDPPVALP